MMGGQVPTSKSAGAGPGAGPGKVGPAPPPTDKGAAVKAPSKPQDVAEFLAKGEGAALLPRKGQVGHKTHTYTHTDTGTHTHTRNMHMVVVMGTLNVSAVG